MQKFLLLYTLVSSDCSTGFFSSYMLSVFRRQQPFHVSLSWLRWLLVPVQDDCMQLQTSLVWGATLYRSLVSGGVTTSWVAVFLHSVY